MAHEEKAAFEYSSLSLCINCSTAAVYQVFSFCPKAKLKPCFFVSTTTLLPTQEFQVRHDKLERFIFPSAPFDTLSTLQHQSKVYLCTTVPRPPGLLPTTCCCRGATRLTLNLVFVCTHLHLSIKVSALQTCMIKQLLKHTK